MSRTVTIVTPENIQITYQVAGIAARFLALLIDLFMRVLLLLLALGIYRLTSLISSIGGLGEYATALFFIATFLIIFAYPIFFEMLWGGRTPGKRLLGLRVIRDGGYPINLVASALRNILLFIDFGIIPIQPVIVLWGLPGLLCLFFSPTYKRIGDYAAGTLVIVETGATALGTERHHATTSPGVAAFLPLVKNVDRLTAREYRILRRFSARRGELDLVAQAALGERLARPLMEKLEIDTTIAFQLQFADLLEAIERRYAEEMGVL